MNINESWHDDAPTSPFVNKEKRCAFKRPSYTGIPVLVSCIVLKDRLNAACGQSLDSVVFLVILGPSLAFYSSYVYSFPFSPERTEFHGFTVFLVLGTSFSWVVVAPLHHWMLLYCLSGCLEHKDWHHWIPLMVLLGVLLALAMATG